MHAEINRTFDRVSAQEIGMFDLGEDLVVAFSRLIHRFEARQLPDKKTFGIQ